MNSVCSDVTVEVICESGDLWCLDCVCVEVSVWDSLVMTRSGHSAYGNEFGISDVVTSIV